MSLPPWIEPEISLGNILTILTLLGTVIAAAQSYGAVVQRVDQAGVDIVGLRQDNINIKADALALGKVVADERLSTATTLAEMKTDIGYIRRYVEDEKRSTRPYGTGV